MTQLGSGALRFLEQGPATASGAYPRYRKLEALSDRSHLLPLFQRHSHRRGQHPRRSPPSLQGRHNAIARLHRLNFGHDHGRSFGTGVKVVRAPKPRPVGGVVRGPLKPGDGLFLRRPPLRSAALREMDRAVKASSKKKANGGRPGQGAGKLALSDLLAGHLPQRVHPLRRGHGTGRESGQLKASTAPSTGPPEPLLAAARPTLSAFPRQDQFLVETCRSRDGRPPCSPFPSKGRLRARRGWWTFLLGWPL